MATYEEKPDVRYDDKASDSQVDIAPPSDGAAYDAEALGVNTKKLIRKV